MNLSSQAGFLLALIGVGLQLFFFSPTKPRYYEKLRSDVINFLLFVFGCTTFMVALGLLFHEGKVFYLLLGTAIASFTTVLLLIVWFIPLLVLSSTNDQDLRSGTAAPVLNEMPRPLLLKLAYSMILFLLPLLIIAHVHSHKQFYISDLRQYQKYTSPPADDLGVGNQNRDIEKRIVSLEPSNLAAEVSEYASAFSLHFLTISTLPCQEKEIDCRSLQNRLSKIQNSRALFVAKVLFYFLALYLIFRYYAQLLQAAYHHDVSDQQNLGLRQDVIKQCSQIVSVAAAFLLALIIAGVDFTSLGIFGGLIGAGLSVALKDLLGNLVAGILLLWDKTIKKDDVITVAPSKSGDTGGTYAIVQKMTMRYTVLQDRSEVRRLIPNSVLTNNVVENWTHEDKKVRLRVLVGVEYGTDLRLARSILESVCYEVERIYTKDRYAPKAVVIGFADSSINFALRFWIEDAQRGIRPILSDLYIAIYERFTEEKIRIPYPRQDVHIVSTETRRRVRA